LGIGRKIGALEAKSKLGQRLDWGEAGEEVIITRCGRPVARLARRSRLSLSRFREVGAGEFGKCFLYELDGAFDICVSGFAAEAEANRCIGFASRKPNRS
jgi:hypothetical protein